MQTIEQEKLPANDVLVNDAIQIVECYDAKILGAPFSVYLHRSVRQTICRKTGAVLRTDIPNVGGLKKKVAWARSLHPRKMTAAEIKFVRKSAGLKAVELANLLDISAEHLSRCESGERVLSGSAEKLFRIIILTRTTTPVKDLEDAFHCVEKSEVQPDVIDDVRQAIERYREALSSLESLIVKMPIQSAFDVSEPLEFSFRIVEMADSRSSQSDDDGEWRPSLAA